MTTAPDKIITGQALRGIVPTLSEDRANTLAVAMTCVFPKYRLTTSTRIRMAIAQMAHESMGFSKKSENLNYSAEAIKRTWPTRFKTVEEAKPYERNPQKLANKVYGGRMGNTEPNDGWLMRGAGFIQLTGKKNISAYAAYRGVSDPYKMAELLRTDDQYALDAACWFLTINSNLIVLMDKNDYEGLTKAINGGLTGLEDRIENYQRAIKYIA